MISISINNFVLILVLFVVAVGITFWLFKRKIDILKKLAYSDELGIFNHRELNKQLNIVIKNKIKKPFAFILIDIDNFKKCNDKYGYDKADILLQKFVNITKAFIRKSDMFFRYKNGDEFAVIVDNIGIEEAKEIGDRLRRSIDMYLFNIDDITVDLTISIGIANSINTDSPKEIRHRAEIALNKAKQTRNTVIVAGE